MKTKFVAGGLGLAALVGAGVAFRGVHRHEAPVTAADTCETAGECRAHAKGGVVAIDKPKGPRILAFSAASCAACKKMEAVVAAAEAACGAARDVTHVDIDGDTGASLAATYAVTSIPAWLSIDAEGDEVSRLVGVQPQGRIEQAIEEVRGERCAAIDRPSGASSVPM